MNCLKLPLKLGISACLLLLGTQASAGLSAQEHRILTQIEAEKAGSLHLLERLVNQNSGTLNSAGVRKVADILIPEFEALGFQVQWIPQDAVERAGHLVATHTGQTGRKRLLLIGHLDTVFEPDHPFQRYTQTGDTATGPGVNDNKGGIVVMLSALKAMKAAGTLEGCNIEIWLTGDEESAGSPRHIARAGLVAAGKRADIALDFEGLSQIDGQDMGVIARRSSNTWSLKVTGNTGHSSGIFSPAVGDGAIFELVRILHAFRRELPEPSLTFNVGMVAGGTTATFTQEDSQASASGKSNIIPPIALAQGDFRTLSNAQTQRIKAKMQAILAQSSPLTKAEIQFEDGYPPMAPTQGNRALLAKLNAVNADLGLPPMPELDPLKRGAGDIGFVAEDVDGLAGLGAAGDGSHSDREFIHIPTLWVQARRAALLMSRLGGEE